MNDMILTACVRLMGCAIVMAALTGCDRLGTGESVSVEKDANYLRARRAADAGDVRVAAGFYDRALKSAPDSARLRLEIGLLHDEKLHDPIAAIYHYNKALELESSVERRGVIEGYIQRAKLALAGNLPSATGSDPVETMRCQTEKAALMQENAGLRLRVSELEKTAVTDPVKPPVVTQTVTTVVTEPPRVRQHVVQPGDTLYSIAQRYYGNRSDWAKVYVANRASLPNRDQLKIGQVLVIP